MSKNRISPPKVFLFLLIAFLLLVVGNLFHHQVQTRLAGSILEIVNGQQVLIMRLPHGSGELLPAGYVGLLTCPDNALPQGFRWSTPQDLVNAGAQDPLLYEYSPGMSTERDASLPLLSRWSGHIFTTRGIATFSIFSAGRTYFLTAANDMTVHCSVEQSVSSSSSSYSVPSSSSSVSTLDLEQWISVGGTRRRYLLHIPPGYNPSHPVPLVLVLHGGGGNAPQARAALNFDAVSDAQSFIVAYPEGTGSVVLPTGDVMGSWNAGGCCGEAALRQIDDVGFINAMLDEVETHYSIDAHRVYATGFSNGSMMMYRLACDDEDRIAAIAPVSGQAMVLSCVLSRSVPTLHIHGLQDGCALYGGSTSSQMCMTCSSQYYTQIGIPVIGPGGAQCPSVPSTINSWRAFNRLTTDAHTTYQTNDVTCSTYDTYVGLLPPSWPTAPTEVTLCSVDGMGHNWPQTNPDYGIAACTPDCSVTSCTSVQQYVYNAYCVPWKNIVGPLSSALDAPSFIWNFFSRYSL